MICIWKRPCCLMLSKKDTIGEFVRIVPGTNYIDDAEWGSIKSLAEVHVKKKDLSYYEVTAKAKDGTAKTRSAELADLNDDDLNEVIKEIVSIPMAEELMAHTIKDSIRTSIAHRKFSIEKDINEQMKAAES